MNDNEYEDEDNDNEDNDLENFEKSRAYVKSIIEED